MYKLQLSSLLFSAPSTHSSIHITGFKEMDMKVGDENLHATGMDELSGKGIKLPHSVIDNPPSTHEDDTVQTNTSSENNNEENVDINLHATLSKLLDAMERLGNRMDNMDKSYSDLLKTMIAIVKKDAIGSAQNTTDHDIMNRSNTTSPLEQPNSPDNTCIGGYMDGRRSFEPTADKPTQRIKNIETIYIYGDEHIENTTKSTPNLKGKYLRHQFPKKIGATENVNVRHVDEDDEGVDLAQASSHTSAAARKLSYPTRVVGRAFKKPKNEVTCNVNNASKNNSRKGSSPREASHKGVGISEKGKGSHHRPNGQTLPKHVNCQFRPTADMGLTLMETQVCAYIFNNQLDPSGNEVFFMVGNNLGTRKEFDTLCPSRIVHPRIILFMALKVTNS
ncbi:Ulp1 protease family, carboxy-terminal domain protein [Spatholobus suberectus]|nr:Ulp1 protease family, carboxy-terminal domain protein [Spatholobus suberectus]